MISISEFRLMINTRSRGGGAGLFASTVEYLSGRNASSFTGSRFALSLFFRVPVNVNGGVYVDDTGVPQSSPTSNVSSVEKWMGTVFSSRPSRPSFSFTDSVPMPHLPAPPPS
jgi:hypothetical protein